MWDTGWLTRHYKYGSFENWDMVLDELSERGYNAIRIDAFPHLVASGIDGKLIDEYYRDRGKNLILEHPWRNPWGVFLKPREGLLEFLPKCRNRGIRVGLSTWFPDVKENRHLEVKGLDDFVRIWDETLTFLDENNLLDEILYIDLLNEYPLWHGFEWLHLMMKSLNAPTLNQQGNAYNDKQISFYVNFAKDAIRLLKEKWAGIDFFFSLTRSKTVLWKNMCLEDFDGLDVHLWFVQHKQFATSTGYQKCIHDMIARDDKYLECKNAMNKYWSENKAELSKWIHSEMEKVAEKGRELNIPYGNTEGWGAINWREHPMLDWTIIKEAGIIGAEYGSELNYKFNCSSNFTHPQFKGLWDDVSWHKEVTRIIKS